MRLEYFQLIDRIADLDLEKRTIRCTAIVPAESTIFEGHFPGYPLMPGVLLTESMAQTAGWLVIGLQRFDKMPFLAALKEVKFRTFVTPGQALEIFAEVVHEGSGYAIADAEVRSGEERICNANITFRIVDFPNAQFVAFMKEFARKIDFPADAVS